MLFLVFQCPYISAQTNTSLSTSAPDSVSAIKTDTIKQDSLNVGLSNELKSKVHYTADDSIVFEVDDQRVFLYKNAQVNYEDVELKADFIRVNWSDKTVLASGMPDSTGKIAGRPVFKQGTDEFKSDTMRYNFDTKKGIVTNISTQQGEGYIHGQTVKKLDEYTYIRHGYYTTCNLDSPHYYIAANKLKVIPNNKIITGPAWLVIADIPTIAAIPFGLFPNTKGRSSGIVIPAYGESGQLGFFLKNGGYYFGLSDKIDLELNGDIYSLGSYAARMHSNYKNRYHYSGAFAFSYEVIKQSEPDLADYSQLKTFFIRWNHSQDPKANPSSIFNANVNAGSTNFYQTGTTAGSNYLANSFSSSISWSKSFPGKPFNLSSGITHSQNSATHEVSLTAPSVVFNVSTLYPFAKKNPEGTPKWYEKINVSYTTNLQNQLTEKDSLFFREQSLDKMRNGMQHSIPVSTSLKVFKFFNLTPSFSYNERWYLQTIRKNYINDTLYIDTVKNFRAARDFATSLSIQTRIYGMAQFKNAKIAAIRHVITPSVSFSYRPDFGEKKFGYAKYYTDVSGRETQYSIFEQGIFGGPAFGKYGFAGFSLDNNLEIKVKQVTDTAINLKKIKLLESLSFSTGYNLAADSLNWSQISMAARTTLFDRMNISANARFDPYVIDSNYRNINVLEINRNNRLARFTNASISTGFNLNVSKKTNTTAKATDTELNQINNNPDDYIDFTIPFNLRVDYSLNYNVTNPQNKIFTQALGFSGDVSLTQNWKVTFNSGYDFKLKDFSYTSIGIYRDLHCWEMHINWIPFGPNQQYNFQINVKSAVLQDLKLVKKRNQYDQ